jgi:protein-S-isoprenylcysteine O-methyltransferase Ste14
MLFPRWIYRFRTYLACLPLIFALVWSDYEIEAEGFIWPIGIGIFLAGVVLRIWAQQHLCHRLRVHKQLITTGPYKFIRNPLYVGNIMICVSATIVSELLWLIPVTLFWCIVTYSTVIRYEEARLLNKYGDAYRRYLLEVPRWFPKMARLKNLELINEHLYQAVLIELPCLLILLPFVIKEIVNK